MKLIVALFWSLILGQIVGYIGSALLKATYQAEPIAIISIIFAIVVWLFSYFGVENKKSIAK